jgi:pulcherriminic acid synthase
VLRDSHPVTFHEATQSWLLSRYADCAAAFRSPAFSSRNYEWQLEPIHGRTILQMEGKEHATHRALLNPFFRGKGLEAFLPSSPATPRSWSTGVVTRAAGDLVDGFAGRGRADLVADFTTWFPINVMVDMLGPPEERPRAVPRLVPRDHGAPEQPGRRPGRHGPRRPDPRGAARVRAADHPRAPRRRRRRPALPLCRAEVDGERMSDEEIKAFVSLLLVAGGETTDKAIASMVRNLLDHPDQLAAVARRPLAGRRRHRRDAPLLRTRCT